MEAKVEQAANEIKRLKAFINNLISVPALPAIWSGGQPPQIVGAFARHAAATREDVALAECAAAC